MKTGDSIKSSREAGSASGWGDWLILGMLFSCTVALFWPAIAWVIGATKAHGQLGNTLAVALFLFVAAWRRDPEGPQPAGRVWREGIGSAFKRMLIGFVLLAVAMLLRQPLLVFAGCGFAVAGWLRVVTGRPRLSDAAGAVAACLFIAALVVGRIDWPLRVLAGQLSLETLKALGLASDLALRVGGGMPPAILLGVEGRLYEVAAECNGFGLVTGSAITAVFFVVYWRMGALRSVALPVLSILSGVIFNSARITAICLLAPRFPGAYDAVHEIVGVALFWTGLYATYKLCRILRHR